MRRGAWEKEIYGGDSVDEDNNGGGDGGDDNDDDDGEDDDDDEGEDDDDDDGEARPGSRREHRMRTGGRTSQREKRPEKYRLDSEL